MNIAGTGSLKNTLVVAARFYNRLRSIKVVTDKECPKDRIYLIDNIGRVHAFQYLGAVPKPGEHGYEPTAEEFEDPDA